MGTDMALVDCFHPDNHAHIQASFSMLVANLRSATAQLLPAPPLTRRGAQPPLRLASLPAVVGTHCRPLSSASALPPARSIPPGAMLLPRLCSTAHYTIHRKDGGAHPACFIPLRMVVACTAFRLPTRSCLRAQHDCFPDQCTINGGAASPPQSCNGSCLVVLPHFEMLGVPQDTSRRLAGCRW